MSANDRFQIALAELNDAVFLNAPYPLIAAKADNVAVAARSCYAAWAIERMGLHQPPPAETNPTP